MSVQEENSMVADLC